jgi:hypothetical protein
LLLCEIATDLKLTIRFSEKVLRLQSSTSEASRRQERARLEEEQGVWTTTVPRMLASLSHSLGAAHVLTRIATAATGCLQERTLTRRQTRRMSASK